jgi:RimJ/RimL family protein N-acetyltransferase
MDGATRGGEDRPVQEPVPDGYPGDLVETAYLVDGTEIVFRPILPTDAERFARLYERLSPEALYRRFFAPVPRLQPAMVRHLVTVDYDSRFALVAVVGDEVVGVARYDRVPPEQADGVEGAAEVAVIVEDAWQGRGIATRLLWRLSAAARERGLRMFYAGVQAENRPMMGLLQVIADEVETRLEGNEYISHVWLDRMRPPR